MIYVVTIPSAYRMGHQCLLGEGTTKDEAMANAYGPKPWPRSSRDADCYAVTEDEAQALRERASE